MCGITGAFAFTQAGRVAFDRIEKANQTLEKRGPDGGNIYCTNSVALGHRRLAIIDVSCAGNQPMQSEDGRYTIVFNGEIFNYKELREAYFSADEQRSLRSQSDTEIFLRLFIQQKEKAFSLLRGFFAAAIYDHVQEELFLVRDRFGKKPLLYYQNNDTFLFASEMKALFALGVSAKVDKAILPFYLQLHYVPQPYSLVQGIKKMLPGHYMMISKEGIQQKPYYRLQTRPDLYEAYTYEAAQKKLVEVMEEATRLRLIADVPVGAFLSGGIDSSVVVALASRHTDKLRTFSIGYKDNPFFDETHYANLVAKKFQTEHTVFSLTTNDFLAHVYDVLNYIDEPFADSSAIPQFILSYHTRRHVTVALSGDGGDEVFAGYRKHGAEWRMQKGGILRSLVKAGSPFWNLLPKSRNNKLTNKIRQLNKFAKAANLSPAERYWQWASFTPQEVVEQLLCSNEINDSSLNLAKQYTSSILGRDFNEVLLADINLVLLSDMLVKVDSMSMANSLEVRSPFLDSEVVDFAFSLPASYKINGQMKKRIVQDAFRSMLPEELYNRPKQGFDIPLLHWFRNELWNEINSNWLADNFIQEQGLFNPVAIENLKRKLHSVNPEDSPGTIWALIVFQYWWKKYVE